MSSAAVTSQKSIFNHRPFLFYFCGRGFARFAAQISSVAIGWQIYTLTNNPFYLGMAGLVQFLPMALFVFVSGHITHRYDRRRIVQISQLVEGLTAVFLAWGSFADQLTVTQIMTAVAVLGTAASFESPAAAALLPGVVPSGMLQKGTAISTSVIQFAIVCGPAIGGFAYAQSPILPYALMTIFWLIASILNALIRLDRPVKAKEPPAFAAVFNGARFVLQNPAILGTISLDLFAVLGKRVRSSLSQRLLG